MFRYKFKNMSVNKGYGGKKGVRTLQAEGETRLVTNIWNKKNIHLLQKRSQELTIYTTA
jgi:hypothetical protein